MNYKQYAVAVAILLAVFFLSSCSAGQANVSGSQRPAFVAASGSPITVTCGPGNVVVGDLNNDRKPDLIVSCEQPPSLTILLGAGDARFRNSTPIPLPVSPGNLALGDLNGDSNLDLAIDSHDSYGVIVMLGDGKGGLAAAPNSPIVMKLGQHPHTHGLAIGDVNGDRKLDLITVNNADNDVSIAFGDGRGGFNRAPTTFPVGPSPYPFALGDINNDGHPDIIATASATGPMRSQQLASSFALTLLLNDGRGGFRRRDPPMRTGQPWHAAIGDVNGDRKPDLVATHHDQSALSVMIGDGTGNFAEAGGSPFDFGRTVFAVALADTNGDGRLDALVAAGEGVQLMHGDGRGNFTTAPGSPFLTGRGVWRIVVADLNGDSKPDVVTTNQESRSISVLLGQ